MKAEDQLDLFSVDSIDQFTGEYRFLSNFYLASFTWNNTFWASSEHAYQAAKATNYADYNAIRDAATPAISKRMGSHIQLREDWDSVKYDLMFQIVWCKFSQNPELATRLIATGTAYLAEGNYHKDNIWGICPPVTGPGTNWLGLILMEVRQHLICGTKPYSI